MIPTKILLGATTNAVKHLTFLEVELSIYEIYFRVRPTRVRPIGGKGREPHPGLEENHSLYSRPLGKETCLLKWSGTQARKPLQSVTWTVGNCAVLVWALKGVLFTQIEVHSNELEYTNVWSSWCTCLVFVLMYRCHIRQGKLKFTRMCWNIRISYHCVMGLYLSCVCYNVLVLHEAENCENVYPYWMQSHKLWFYCLPAIEVK